MKLHSVGWFCVICWQAVITLSGLYCSVHSEMKREGGGVGAESGTKNGAREYIYNNVARNGVVRVSEVDLLSSLLLKYGYQHENSNIQRARIDLNKLEIIGEEKLVTLGLNCSGFYDNSFLKTLRHLCSD